MGGFILLATIVILLMLAAIPVMWVFTQVINLVVWLDDREAAHKEAAKKGKPGSKDVAPF